MARFGFGQLSGLDCFGVRDAESERLPILFSLCGTPNADTVDLRMSTPNTALEPTATRPFDFETRYED